MNNDVCIPMGMDFMGGQTLDVVQVRPMRGLYSFICVVLSIPLALATCLNVPCAPGLTLYRLNTVCVPHCVLCW